MIRDERSGESAFKDFRGFDSIRPECTRFDSLLDKKITYKAIPLQVGRQSSVGIATSYGLDGPGIESRWGRDFPQLSRLALGPTHPHVQWVPGLSRGKERSGCDADPSPLLVPCSRKSRAIPLLPLWAVRPVQSLSACTRVNFTSFNPITDLDKP